MPWLDCAGFAEHTGQSEQWKPRWSIKCTPDGHLTFILWHKTLPLCPFPQENTTWIRLNIIWTWESIEFSMSREFGSEHKYGFGWDRPAPGISYQCNLLSCRTKWDSPDHLCGLNHHEIKGSLKIDHDSLHSLMLSHSWGAPLIRTLQQNMGSNYHAECMLGCSTCVDGQKAKARKCRKWKTDGAGREHDEMSLAESKATTLALDNSYFIEGFTK